MRVQLWHAASVVGTTPDGRARWQEGLPLLAQCVSSPSAAAVHDFRNGMTGVTAAAPFAHFALHASSAASCAVLASLVLRRSGFWPSFWPAPERSDRLAAQSGPAGAEPLSGSDVSGVTGTAAQSAAAGGTQSAVGITTRHRRRAGANGGDGVSQNSAGDEKVII